MLDQGAEVVTISVRIFADECQYEARRYILVQDLGCGQGRNEGRCDLYVEVSRELALLAPSGRRQSGPPGDGSSETTYALIAGRP